MQILLRWLEHLSHTFDYDVNYSCFYYPVGQFSDSKEIWSKRPAMGSFRNLSLPRSLLWYYLIVIGVDALAHPDQGTYLYTVVINARYILEMFLIFQGLAFVLYIFYQSPFPRVLTPLW